MPYPEIVEIVPGSLAAEIGITPGSQLLEVNGEAVIDILDYRLALVEEEITLSLLDEEGQQWFFEIEKDYGEDLGLIFAHPTLAPIKYCRNNCLFCFINQLPGGVRPTLRVKDDDYRLSSFHGSFVTLTNLSESDWQRLLTLRPSPLYISVHSTNGELRSRMLGNLKAGVILDQLHTLAAHHIEMHCQIVLVPGVNDGAELKRTMDDLEALWPAVQSVAVVPVGLTAHRENLPVLESFTKEQARTVIDYALPWAEDFRLREGLSFFYLADEFFLLAGSEVPSRAYYDDFPQIENGIGLVRQFSEEVAEALDALPSRLEEVREVLWVTGRLAAPLLVPVKERLNRIHNLWVDICPVTNTYFGDSVTVAGLLTGQDIVRALRETDTANKQILIPAVTLREHDGDFLCGMTFKELEQAFPDAGFIITAVDGEALVAATLGEEASIWQ